MRVASSCSKAKRPVVVLVYDKLLVPSGEVFYQSFYSIGRSLLSNFRRDACYY
uniref:Uncharacterized protein n=1 Tax=Rhizophora mucronata TaxID=61149 RepID=A0A2P2J5E1_RHIMU